MLLPRALARLKIRSDKMGIYFCAGPKWSRTLATLLSVLAAAYLLTFVPRPSTRPKTPAVPKEIQRFSLVSPGLSLMLENTEGRWWITSPIHVPANEGTVVSFLGSLRSLTLEEVLSRRPESHALFKVDETSAVHLKVWAPNAPEPHVWVVGKDSPSGAHVYVRVANGKDVYLARGLSRALAEAGLLTWRDRRVLDLAPETVIQSVQVRRNQTTLVLERSSSTWTVNGMPADGEKVDRLMSSLRYLSADDFVDPPESLGPIADSLRPPSAELTVTLGPGGASGKTHILCFGRPDKRDPSRVLLRRDTDPHLLWVTVSHFDVLKVNIKDLLSK